MGWDMGWGNDRTEKMRNCWSRASDSDSHGTGVAAITRIVFIVPVVDQLIVNQLFTFPARSWPVTVIFNLSIWMNCSSLTCHDCSCGSRIPG